MRERERERKREHYVQSRTLAVSLVHLQLFCESRICGCCQPTLCFSDHHHCLRRLWCHSRPELEFRFGNVPKLQPMAMFPENEECFAGNHIGISFIPT